MKVKKDMYKVNVRNVRRLIRFLKTIPPKMYDQEVYGVDKGGYDINKETKVSCGGAACLCGWINSRFTHKRLDDSKSARNFLGFKAKVSDWDWGIEFPQSALFYSTPEEWPRAASIRYQRAQTNRGRLNAAIAALEQIAKDRRYEPGVTK